MGKIKIQNVISVSGCGFPGRLALVPMIIILMLTSPASADFEFPRLSASLGVGYGGCYHSEYVAGTYHSTQFGGNSSHLWWTSLACVYPSGMTIGVQTHLLRISLDDGQHLGTFSVRPLTFHAGYFQPLGKTRLIGFASAGAGIAWASFHPSSGADAWENRDGESVRVSNKHPFVFEGQLGLGYSLSDDFLVEAKVATVLMDTNLYYTRVVDDGGVGVFRPEYADEMKGRHLQIALGFRWWFEWW